MPWINSKFEIEMLLAKWTSVCWKCGAYFSKLKSELNNCSHVMCVCSSSRCVKNNVNTLDDVHGHKHQATERRMTLDSWIEFKITKCLAFAVSM